MNMEATAHFTIFASLAMLLSFFLSLAWFHSKPRSIRSLPGPWGLPIIGHLHLLDYLLHRSLHKLSKIYGPIMHLRLGLVPAIVVSSPEAAELFLKTNDANTATKPNVQLNKYVSYGGKGIVFTEYGRYWRYMRKICTMHLFRAAKTDLLRSNRQNEIGKLIELLKRADHRHEVVDISSHVGMVNEAISYRMLFGHRTVDERFISCIEEISRLGVSPNLADYIPFLGALDLQGFTWRWKAVRKIVDEILEKIINEHEQESTEKQEQLGGFINVLMSLMKSNNPEEKLNRNEIKANLVELVAAAADTSPRAIEWTFSELLRHPQAMKKAQHELERVVGHGRQVEESDLENLEYLDMVVKESLRLHPVASIYVHESINDISLNGTVIPSKTMIIINSWAIGRDPVAWPEKTEEFYPERFTNSQIDVRGHDMQLLPFGSGRRKCPGLEMGLIIVKLVAAQLIHCFDWELPGGMPLEGLDMEEAVGMIVPRANPLLLIPTYKLSMDHDV